MASEIPYYLMRDVGQKSSTEILNVQVTTQVPTTGINWDSTPTVWEEISDSASGALESAKAIPGKIFDTVKDAGSSVLSAGESALGYVGDTVTKYFLLVAGVLILIVFVAGKSGALRISKV